MLAAETLDAAVIAPPHHLLHECCLAAIGAGLHVFVEKPMGVNAREAAEIHAAAGAAGVKLMVGYCLRFNAVRTGLKDLLAQGALGEVTAIVGGKGSRPWSNWLADPKQGGGQMLFLGSHLIDQVLWLVRSPVESVYAEMTRRQETGVDETSAFTLRFANGVRAELLVSQRAGVSYDFLDVIGSGGRARSEWPRMLLDVHSWEEAAFKNPAAIRVLGDSHRPMYVAELAEFVAAIHEDREPAVTGADAVRTLAVIDAVFASAQAGQPVPVAAPAGA